MRIYVCVKQVPDTETKIKLTGDGKIDLNGVKWVVNPYDEFAIEEALNLKTKLTDSKVTIVSLGPKKRTTDAIRTALAMGADDGILIDCEDDLDQNGTAKAIAEAIKQEGEPAIVFAGKLSIDDNGAGLPQILAEYLNLPHVSVIHEFETADNTFTVTREAESGSSKTYQVTGPCVLSTNKGLNTPRYASLPGIMKAKKKPLKEVAFADLGVSNEINKVTYKSFQLPAEKPEVKYISGEAANQAAELVNLLKNEAKVL